MSQPVEKRRPAVAAEAPALPLDRSGRRAEVTATLLDPATGRADGCVMPLDHATGSAGGRAWTRDRAGRRVEAGRRGRPLRPARRPSAWRCGRVALACAVAAVGAALLPAPAAAQAEEPFLQIRNNLILEGKSERNLELEREDVEKAHEVEPQWRFSATLGRGRPVWGFVETELVHEIERQTGDPQEHRNILRLNQAYLAFEDLLPSTRLRLGRWLHRDEREWLFDENFDGLHVDVERGDWQVELFGARVNHWQRDLLDSHTRGQPVDYLAALVRREIREDWTLGAYAVQRHDFSGGRDRLSFLGLRSHAVQDEGLRHWAEIGLVRGHEDGRRVSGHVVDVGATQVFDGLPWEPRLTLGYAYASGDGDPGGRGRDRGYRQTTLQSNEATYGGLAKFKVYGEALDPDLTNLEVVTAGLGARPVKGLTLDLIYHRYRQARVAPLVDAEIEPKGDTLSGRRLGEGIDLVVGWRPVREFTVELALGRFLPAARLRDDDDLEGSRRGGAATTARIEVDWRF